MASSDAPHEHHQPNEHHDAGIDQVDPEDGIELHRLGADATRLEEIAATLGDAPPGALAGRVGRVDRGRFNLITPDGTVAVATSGMSAVAVGDWCIVVEIPGADGEPVDTYDVWRVLPRATALVRQASGKRTEMQALAANMDTIMILVPLDRRISPRQLERFLVLAWDSGATPVLVLTKVDLVSDDIAADAAASAHAVGGDLPVLTTSVVSGRGLENVAALVAPGHTVALLGTSGSGKSSMVNALLGADAVATGPVRQSDAKGRHTTTWRELLVTPAGGVLIDTPGLRELGLWISEEGIDAAFSDVTDLAELCRFNDCAHVSEPGCAVLDAIASGTLDPDRLASYRQLQSEAAFAARKVDQRLAKEELRVWRLRAAEGRSRARP